MNRFCFYCLTLYGLLCIVSLILIPLNAGEVFGMTADPLSGIFALLLSAPWSILLSRLINLEGNENLILVVTGMVLNGCILVLILLFFRRLKR